jgi:hypothetical protein
MWAQLLCYNLLVARFCAAREYPTFSVYTGVNTLAKKQFFAICDTETTIADTVADFAIIICDRDGVIHNQCAVIIAHEFNTHALFFDGKIAEGLWSKSYALYKRDNYNRMLETGQRMAASVAAVNRWINQAIGKYNPTLTAYNLAFDKSKCVNTGIELSGFNSEFCLWQAAVGNICKTKKYRQFALDNHLFGSVTKFGNMTFKTTAESVCGFIRGEFTDEPHTALEDARDFELPILQNILRRARWRDKIEAYNWRDFQVKDNFAAK